MWLRNPNNYIREAVEAGAFLFAWDRGQIVKSQVDVIKHAELYLGTTVEWRVLAIGIQGAAEYRTGTSWFSPTAVYPVWEYGEDLGVLVEMLESPVGEDSAACMDINVPGDERPVMGQEHRIVITNIPNLSTGAGRQFMSQLRALQEDYPEAILHLHGLYSYRFMFGMGFRSADVDPRTDAQKGHVMLPLGKKVSMEMAADAKNIRDVQMLGFKPVDLQDPKTRCIFNIKSAEWASKNFANAVNFRTRAGGGEVDTITPENSFVMKTRSGPIAPGKAQEGDKVTCNTCSLAGQCTYFREGSVCTLPNAAPRDLASQFGTRDTETIIDGLTSVTQLAARRMQRGVKAEEAIGDVDPEVTKLITQVFKMGTEMAKLLDPGLRGGAKVQVNVGNQGNVSVGSINPKQAIAQVMRELESQGYARDQITPELVTRFLGDAGSVQQAIDTPKLIEAQVIEP